MPASAVLWTLRTSFVAAESVLPNADPAADWAPAAERDLDEIWDYYAENASPDTAHKLLERIIAAVARVAGHPFHGRARVDLRPNLRCVRVTPYIVFYRTTAYGIEVVRVLHERRDLATLLGNAPDDE
jgi:toxin ParE1/3/4